MPSYRTYPPAPFGLGTQFPEQERPPTHATELLNRFINPGGGAEKRQGIVTAATLVSGPDFTWAEEFVHARGTTQLVLAGGSGVFTVDSSAGTTITTAFTGLNASGGTPRIIQSDDKLIVVNGEDRNQFTTDLKNFREMRALVDAGSVSADVSVHDTLVDNEIEDWLTQTDVADNDLLFDATTSAYAIITDVATAALTHSPLTANTVGLGSGNAAKAGGDLYEIHDLVELNVIPSNTGGGVVELDNVAVGETGTSAPNVKVAGIDWRNTDVKVGDYIHNTTRNQVARVENINVSSLAITSVEGQVCGDSLVFLKSAMPIASNVHVHYGRTYYTDARDERKIRISGPLDPQDMTTDAGTLDSTTFKFGTQQPIGDRMIAMASYQQYLAIAGKQYILLFSGTDPIVDASADRINFTPQALFPVGVASPDSLLTIGNDLVWLGNQGMESAALRGSDNLPSQEHLSENIRSEIQQAVSGVDASKIKIFNYPKRHWVVAKVSTQLFVFNYSPYLGAEFQGARDIGTALAGRGSWSRFEGDMASLNHYLVKENQGLVGVGTSGQLFNLDVPGVYKDGQASAFRTKYQTSWLGLDEAQGRGQPSRRQKHGVAILPQTDASTKATYKISVTAPYNAESSESVTETVSGETQPRIPLRWRGDRARFTFETSADTGVDILTSYTVVYNKYGVK